MAQARDVVVDASAIVAVILGEPERGRIVNLTSGRRLVSPGCLPWEIGNAFSALVRRKRLTVADARRGIELFDGIRIRYADVDLATAVDTAAEAGLYAYDAYYLECARQMRAPLLTLDRALRGAADAMGLPALEV